MTKYVSDVLDIMRLTLGRRNENDSDSDNAIFLKYVNDFTNITMSNDVKFFEQFDTLSFTIGDDPDNDTGIYTFNDVGASSDFVNISQEGFISLTDPVNESISWNKLWITQDAASFYDRWGINNDDVMIRGFPTEMLYYGDTMVFRTIPETDVSYTVNIYGYKEVPEFSTSGEALPFKYYVRFIAYGAALNYAMDFRYAPDELGAIKQGFARERKLLMTKTHNQVKLNRAKPNF